MMQPHVVTVWRAEIKNEDREAAQAMADLMGTPLFDEMYNVTGSESIDVVLPPRDSAAHKLTALLSWMIQVDGAVAAREDLLPDSSEPGKKFFINTRGPHALQIKSVYFLVSRLSLGCIAALIFFAGIAFYLFRRSRRAAL
jgi:hypothetical protein